MNRRRFLKLMAPSAAALALGGAAYGFHEASHIQVERPRYFWPDLHRKFEGLTIAFLTDILHGPYQDDEHLRSVVRTTQLLEPDLIVFGGNYSLRDARYIQPTFEILRELRAPMGKYGVLASHDHRLGAREVRDGFRRANIADLTDTGHWLTRDAGRLRISGLNDPDGADEPRLLIHNDPVIGETIRDRRVELVLCGMSRVGQVRLPGLGSPWLGKYQAGFVSTAETTIYVSRGLGVAGLPVRYGSRPEITLLTLMV